MATAWPGEYGPKVVMLFLSEKSWRSRAWKASAASRATAQSGRMVPRCSATSRAVWTRLIPEKRGLANHSRSCAVSFSKSMEISSVG